MNSISEKVFVVLNPASGQANPAQIHTVLGQYFAPPAWDLEIYEITGQEDVTAITRAAREQGASLVVAAGGDGTVLSVANGLVNSHVPLGLIPLGTGNDLARVLMVPLDVEKAIQLLSGPHREVEIDALQVEDRYFFSNVSAGISPRVMRETRPEQKKRFGVLAYVWTMLKRSSIFQLHTYKLTIDGRPQMIRAAEILISNTTLLDRPPRIFGPPESICDHQLEAYLVTARNFREYLGLVWSLLRHPGKSAPQLYHLSAKDCVRIDANPHPRSVQADGEVIGRTPVEIKIAPQVLRVIAPDSAAAAVV